MRCGTLSTRVPAIRLPCGAAGVRPARPLRPGQGCRDPDLAPSGGRAPAAGEGPGVVAGCPGAPGPAGPAAARQPAPPVAPDRLAADCAVLARRPRPPVLGLPAPRSRAAPDRAVRAGAGAGDGAGQPGLGLPAYPRRTG